MKNSKHEIRSSKQIQRPKFQTSLDPHDSILECLSAVPGTAQAGGGMTPLSFWQRVGGRPRRLFLGLGGRGRAPSLGTRPKTWRSMRSILECGGLTPLSPDATCRVTAKLGLVRALQKLALGLLLLPSLFCLCAQAQDYAIDWYTIDGGGGQSTDGYYTITGTIGQPDAGVLSDGYYTLVGGFWGVLAVVQAPGMPGLTIERTATNSVIVSWPASWVEWHLQQCPDLRAEYWTDVPTAPQAVAGRMQVVVAPPVGNRFYRLSTEPSRPPTLTVTLTATNSVLITWPVSVDTWQLQACTDLGAADWANVDIPPVQVDGHWQVVISPIPGMRYYRLVQVTVPTSPTLSIVLTATNTVVVSWALAGAEGWVLQATNALPGVAAPWPVIPPPYQTNGPNLQFIDPTPSGSKFYRLHKP